MHTESAMLTQTTVLKRGSRRPRCAPLVRASCWVPLLLGTGMARAASGEFVDTVADVMAVIVLILVPVIAILVFWMVHVLPEKIAHKRHHPQRDAITTLCLLSLVFGGLLWPLAWLWAYTRPIGYRMAYGTDKHEDYYGEMDEKHRAGQLLREDIIHLRQDLAAMEAKGALPPKLRKLKEEIEQLGDEEPAAVPDEKGAA